MKMTNKDTALNVRALQFFGSLEQDTLIGTPSQVEFNGRKHRSAWPYQISQILLFNQPSLNKLRHQNPRLLHLSPDIYVLSNG